MDDPRHKSYALGWNRAAVELRRIHREEIRATDTPRALQQLAGAFDDAVRRFPPRASSGLVEQQRLFQILARRLKLA